MKLTLVGLFALTLLSCSSRDVGVTVGDGQPSPVNYGDVVPQGHRQPTSRDHRRGIYDGKFDARNGYRYAIRGGNWNNQVYIDGYSQGYHSIEQ